MLGIDGRAFRIVWTVFLFALLLAVIYFIRDTILLLAAAVFFAYMLSPMVELIERFMPKRRNLALGLVYILLIGILVGVGFKLIPALADQATSLAKRLPDLISRGNLAKLPLPSFLEPVRERIMEALSREAVNLESAVVPFIQQAGTRILSGVGALLPFILIPIFSFFLLKDAREIRGGFLGTFSDDHKRELWAQILDDVHIVLSKYIRALLILALGSFAAWAIFLSAMGYQYELLLAGTAGLLEFIPVVGPAAALATMLIVYGITGSGGLLWIIVFFACFRVFQDYVLNPILMSAGIELHPLLVLCGVLAGEAIGGIPGMFFSLPVIAILRVVLLHLRSSDTRKQISAGSRLT